MTKKHLLFRVPVSTKSYTCGIIQNEVTPSQNVTTLNGGGHTLSMLCTDFKWPYSRAEQTTNSDLGNQFIFRINNNNLFFTGNYRTFLYMFLQSVHCKVSAVVPCGAQPTC